MTEGNQADIRLLGNVGQHVGEHGLGDFIAALAAQQLQHRARHIDHHHGCGFLCSVAQGNRIGLLLRLRQPTFQTGKEQAQPNGSPAHQAARNLPEVLRLDGGEGVQAGKKDGHDAGPAALGWLGTSNKTLAAKREKYDFISLIYTEACLSIPANAGAASPRARAALWSRFGAERRQGRELCAIGHG